MTDINDIVEESARDRFYVFRGHKGATAIELCYDGMRVVYDEGSRAKSLVKAKLGLYAYKVFAYHSRGMLPPLDRYATFTPVFAATRDAELRELARLDLVRTKAAMKAREQAVLQ